MDIFLFHDFLLYFFFLLSLLSRTMFISSAYAPYAVVRFICTIFFFTPRSGVSPCNKTVRRIRARRRCQWLRRAARNRYRHALCSDRFSNRCRRRRFSLLNFQMRVTAMSGAIFRSIFLTLQVLRRYFRSFARASRARTRLNSAKGTPCRRASQRALAYARSRCLPMRAIMSVERVDACAFSASASFTFRYFFHAAAVRERCAID